MKKKVVMTVHAKERLYERYDLKDYDYVAIQNMFRDMIKSKCIDIDRKNIETRSIKCEGIEIHGIIIDGRIVTIVPATLAQSRIGQHVTTLRKHKEQAYISRNKANRKYADMVNQTIKQPLIKGIYNFFKIRKMLR